MPATFPIPQTNELERAMTAVMIGVDPHKATHTAVVIGPAEEPLGELRVRASAAQAEKLVAWAAAWPERIWAVEGAAGLGRLLAQQLVVRRRAGPGRSAEAGVAGAAAGSLATRTRTTRTTRGRWRSRRCGPRRARPVIAEDHPAVLKVRAERHRDLAGYVTRPPAGCTPCSATWSPAASRRRSPQLSAARILEQASPSGAVGQARAELAAEFLEDVRRLDAQLRGTRKKLAAAVRSSGTTLTEVFGVGPVIAGTIIGEIADVSRFPSRDHFASYNGTAPVEVSSGNRKTHRLSLRGNRRINHAIHMAAITQIRHKHSAGRAYYDKKLAEGKTRKEALRSLKRRVSDAIYARLLATPGEPDSGQRERPGRATGERLCIQRGRIPPTTGSSDKPLPDLGTTIRPRAATRRLPLPGRSQAFLDSRHPAVSEAAGPGGAPAAKRGRTTWRRASLTAILGPRGRPGTKPLDTKRHSIWASSRSSDRLVLARITVRSARTADRRRRIGRQAAAARRSSPWE